MFRIAKAKKTEKINILKHCGPFCKMFVHNFSKVTTFRRSAKKKDLFNEK
jgi:hypothetical protein